MKTLEAKEKFLNHCENKALSQETLDWYGIILDKFNDKFPELPLDPDVIEGYYRDYAAIAGCERVHGVHRGLKCFYRFLYKRHGFANIYDKVDPPRRKHKEKKIPAPEEIQKLLDYPYHPRYVQAIIKLLLDTGARIGEIANLRPCDLIPGGYVRLNGKTGERIVPVSDQVFRLLKSISRKDFRKGWSFRPDRLDKIFLTNLETIMKAVKEAFENAGLYPYGAHSLRHYFVTYYDGNLQTLQEITGHSTLAMVANYHHYRRDRAKEDHEKHSPLLKLNLKEKSMAMDLEAIFIDSGIKNREETKKYLEPLIKEDCFTEYEVTLMASSFNDGYEAALKDK